MRKLLIIVTLAVITTAIISTSLTFVLFQKMALQEKEAKTELPSQLVNNKNVNIKPKALPENFVQTASSVTPAIVNITIDKGDPNESKGSGVIIRANGYIVTNNHVVGDAEKCRVT